MVKYPIDTILALYPGECYVKKLSICKSRLKRKYGAFKGIYATVCNYIIYPQKIAHRLILEVTFLRFTLFFNSNIVLFLKYFMLILDYPLTYTAVYDKLSTVKKRRLQYV